MSYFNVLNDLTANCCHRKKLLLDKTDKIFPIFVFEVGRHGEGKG